MDDVEIVRMIERAPLRTVRWEDIDAQVPNAARTLNRLLRNGALTRIAKGVYVAPPNGADGRGWKAPLEAGAVALATARFGERRAILAGIGAARFWRAIPRAIATTVVAVDVTGRHPVVLETGGTVHFVHRDLARIDATLERTALGEALVATPAQTLFDLLAKPDQGGARAAAGEAVRILSHRVGRDELVDIADRAERVPPAVGALLTDMAVGAA